MSVKILVNLSAIDFTKTLGVWIFAKQLISALGRDSDYRVIGLKPMSALIPADERCLFHEIVEVNAGINEDGAVELLLHHFQKPLSSCRTIVIFHDLHLWDVPWKYGNAIAQRGALGSLIAGASAVVTHFPRTYFDLPRFIECVPNAFFLTISPTMQPYRCIEERIILPLCRRLNINADNEVVLFPGQYQEHKNHLTLFKALREINNPNVRLVCSGSEFKESHTTTLRAAISELGLDSQIVLAGHLADTELVALLHRADLVISPSLAEGGAYIVQEGILYKKKVCVSRIRPAMMHIKVMGASIPTFDPLDVTEMAETIKFSLTNSQDNSRAYETISQWTWEGLAMQYQKIIQWVYEGCPETRMPALGPEELGMALSG